MIDKFVEEICDVNASPDVTLLGEYVQRRIIQAIVIFSILYLLSLISFYLFASKNLFYLLVVAIVLFVPWITAVRSPIKNAYLNREKIMSKIQKKQLKKERRKERK